MNIKNILDQLRAERDRIERAMTAIEGLDSTGRGTAGRPAQISLKHRTFSAATRARMAAAQRARWAKAKPTAPKRARRMSAAGRKRIAKAAKRRWAEWRKRTKAA